jgi:chemotaxis protein CheX
MHLISGFIRGATREIFSTMAQLEVISLEDVNDIIDKEATISGVIGTVGVTGKMNGNVYLNFSTKLARDITGRILGSDPATVANEEIGDVVGELTNMVTGNLKSKMTDQGYNCVLSIPSVMVGDKVLIESTQSSIKLYNQFEVKDLNEKVNVYVFARLETKS